MFVVYYLVPLQRAFVLHESIRDDYAPQELHVRSYLIMTVQVVQLNMAVFACHSKDLCIRFLYLARLDP